MRDKRSGDIIEVRRAEGEPDFLVPMLVEIGARFRALREAVGMTQAQFREAAGVSQRYAWSMEAGRQNLSIRSLTRVALPRELRSD